MLRHVKGNTYIIGDKLSIPVFYLDDSTVVMLDSGTGYRERDIIKQYLDETGVTVRAVINSHAHYDHVGNDLYLRDRCGAELIINEIEAAVMKDYSTLTAYYITSLAYDWKANLPDMKVEFDRTFTSEDRFIDIGGAEFGLIHLPGHTAGHTGILTPDNILYVADAVAGEKVIDKAKLPTTLDWHTDLETKAILMDTEYDAYILAHGGLYSDIRPIVDYNIQRRQEKMNSLLDIINTLIDVNGGSASLEMIQMAAADSFRIRGGTLTSQTVFQRNLLCMLDYLVREDKLSRDFSGGRFIYSRS